MSEFIYSEFKSVAGYVPDEILTNHDLSDRMDTSDEWIVERSGIKQRHIVKDGESTSSLGAKAAVKALSKAGLEASELDLIIAATLSPDYYFPGIGVLIQSQIGASCPAIDVRGQCSGFSWALSTADAFMGSRNYKNVLIVGAEIHSRMLEFSNRGRNTAVLFGDGAGAAVLQAKSSTSKPATHNLLPGVIDNIMGSDGEGAGYLGVFRPGHAGEKEFLTPQECEDKVWIPHMDGKHVFKNAVSRMTEVANKIMKRNKISAKDIDLLIPHQANIRINNLVAKNLGLSSSQVFNNICEVGNTTSASIPLCMQGAEEAGVLTRGKLVITLAFGAGFTWGANLFRW